MLIFSEFFLNLFSFVGYWIHISHSSTGACMYPRSDTRLEPYYLSPSSSAINGKLIVRKKGQTWDISMKKKVKNHWITAIQLCPILGPHSAWSCAKLTFILKSGFILSVGGRTCGWGGLSPTLCVCKKGQLHQFDWRAVENAEGCSVRAGFTHQYSSYGFPPSVF